MDKDGWQSMDSAPRDGTEVMLAAPMGDLVYVVPGWHYDGDETTWVGWHEVNTHPLDYHAAPILNPFAWQPYPAPPSGPRP